jgi:hypothetical protein
MATNSGLRRLVHGTRERILSSDHNREQSFEAAMLADVLRHLLDTTTLEEQAAGVESLGSILTTPLRAIVINGLRVRPEIGTFNLFVEPGITVAVDPGSPASPDDSVAQVVRSAGQQVAGALVISTPGGSTRIDVIECSISQVVIEADNRDVFSPSTGTFTPQLVNKVVEAQLTFRVRAGTPGAGYPGAAAGWLPLAIARVPTAAASNDTCDFWDVRPLYSDLAGGANRIARSLPGYDRQHGAAIEEGAGNWRARGIIETDLLGWKLGGDLAPAAAGTTYLDLTSGGPCQEPGFAAVALRPWYLYLAHPHSLPRWAKYSPASSGSRVPLAPRGIPILSMTGPSGFGNGPFGALALPTSTGLGGTTTNAAVVMTGAFIAGPTWRGSAIANGFTYVRTGISASPTSGAATNSVTYTFTGNLHHPSNASELLLRFDTTVADAGGTIYPVSRQLTVFDAAGNQVFVRQEALTQTVPSGGSYTDRWEVTVPLPPNFPIPTTQTLTMVYIYSTNAIGAPVYSGQGVVVEGWRMGG